MKRLPLKRRSGFKADITLRQALEDPNLLGNVLAGDSWKPWRTLLIASMGEALTDDERTLFKELTGRTREPLRRVEEFAGVVGRRGGKSRAISVLTTYLAGLCQHPALVPGERGIVLCIGPDQKQADIVLNYIEANFRNSPVLSQLIDQRVQRSLQLTNNIDIEVRASDFRRLRGPTYIAVIGDEVAFWLSENSSNPDTEILNAVRPGLATTGGPLFLISSPYARRGELWRTYDKHFGAAGDPLVLVAQGTSRELNPSLPQSVVDRAMERDPASAAAEYGAQFRADIEAFISLEAVRACVSTGVFEIGPQRGLNYHCFVDPSGGSVDSITLCIGHYDFGTQIVVIDCLREVKPPFDPGEVVTDFSNVMKSYGVLRCTGDRYGGIWPAAEFSKCSIYYEASIKPKSDLYQNLLPLINARRIELLDSERLVNQLVGLERRTARSGKDSIDHCPGGHDDVCNVVAGMSAISTEHGGFDSSYSGFQDDADDPDGTAGFKRLRLQSYLRSCGIPV